MQTFYDLINAESAIRTIPNSDNQNLALALIHKKMQKIMRNGPNNNISYNREKAALNSIRRN